MNKKTQLKFQLTNSKGEKFVEYFNKCLTKLLLYSLCLNRQFQKSKSLHVDSY